MRKKQKMRKKCPKNAQKMSKNAPPNNQKMRKNAQQMRYDILATEYQCLKLVIFGPDTNGRTDFRGRYLGV